MIRKMPELPMPPRRDPARALLPYGVGAAGLLAANTVLAGSWLGALVACASVIFAFRTMLNDTARRNYNRGCRDGAQIALSIARTTIEEHAAKLDQEIAQRRAERRKVDGP